MFRINRLTDYAVAVMGAMHRLEQQNNGKNFFSVAELSSRSNIAQTTIAKVLKMLTKGKLVFSRRGTSGGYALVKKAGEICLLEIIEAMEGPVCLTQCVDNPEATCKTSEGCMMKGRWEPVNNALVGGLKQVTLADMFE